jgi:hypothetical protein
MSRSMAAASAEKNSSAGVLAAQYGPLS